MGVIAGLLQLRCEEDQNHQKNFFHDIFPWTATKTDTLALSKEARENTWRCRVDRNGLILVSIIILSLLRTILPSLPYLNIKCQFVCVHLQLVVIVGLARDAGKSWLGQICRYDMLAIRAEYLD